MTRLLLYKPSGCGALAPRERIQGDEPLLDHVLIVTRSAVILSLDGLVFKNSLASQFSILLTEKANRYNQYIHYQRSDCYFSHFLFLVHMSHTMTKVFRACVVLTLFLLANAADDRTCYYLDGSTANNHVPCTTNSVTNCCGSNDICLSNGLCYLQGSQGLSLSRGTCSDKNWGFECYKPCCTSKDTVILGERNP